MGVKLRSKDIKDAQSAVAQLEKLIVKCDCDLLFVFECALNKLCNYVNLIAY